MRTMEKLVRGYYEQAARMVKDTDDDAGLALYLRSSEMLLVLRDLLGHTSVLTTEAYLSRLDTSRSCGTSTCTRAGNTACWMTARPARGR